MDLLSRCDAEASGAAAAVFTYERVTLAKAEELRFCVHHAAQHGPALKLAGWSPTHGPAQNPLIAGSVSVSS